MSYDKQFTIVCNRINQLEKSLQKTEESSEQTDRKECLKEVFTNGELLSRAVRKLICESSLFEYSEEMEQLCQIHNITVTQKDEGVLITLPVIPLTKRTHSNGDFTNEPLKYAMAKFVSEIHPSRFTEATILYRHIYPDANITQSYHDYDNCEIKHIQDTITLYLLIDDSIRYVDVIHTAEARDNWSTEIEIMPGRIKAKPMV